MHLCSGALLMAVALSAAETPDPAYDPKLHGLLALTEGSGFVRIPGGEFTMGSADGNADEQPVRRIRITRPFEMGKFEVTQAQWDAVMRTAHPTVDKGKQPQAEASEPPNPSHFKGATRPVEKVTFPQVQEFLRRLNTRDPRYIYRLPTEAEWEYACRAGSSTEGSAADAWTEADAGGTTHPVGKRKPNAWGLHDMLGNVWEWVQDWYDSYDPRLANDPQGGVTGSYRVYRGGSWSRAAADARCAIRGFDFPNDGYYNVGFRLVRTVK